MKKKITAVLLAAAAVTGLLAGCGNNASSSKTPETQQSSAAESGGESQTTGTTAAGQWKIGYNYYNGSSYGLATLRDNVSHVVDAFGGTSLAIDDERSVEKIIQDLENMIASGCDGILVWSPADNIYPAISQLCKDAKIPFVLCDKIPSDPDVLAQLKENPYCVGAVGPDNSVYGQVVAQYAVDNGYKTCMIASGDIADPSDAPRIAAFKEVFQNAGGTIVEEIHVSNATEAQAAIENAFVVNPDPDFIYGTGPDYAKGASNALNGKGYNTAILTSGLDTTTLDMLVDENNPTVLTIGDYWVCGTYAAVILQNYLDGTPLTQPDGSPIWYSQVPPFTVTDRTYELYKKFFIDEYCFTDEELRGMSGANDPEFNYDSFVKIIEEHSLDNVLKKRYEEGRVTAEELRAAGYDY